MIPNVLIDTDVMLDIFLDREPHNGPSKAVMALLGRKRFCGHITATIVINIFFLSRSQTFGKKQRLPMRSGFVTHEGNRDSCD